MRKVQVRRTKEQTEGKDSERLVSLLAAGLDRLLTKHAQTGEVVDFSADESVTTTCPEGAGGEEPGA